MAKGKDLINPKVYALSRDGWLDTVEMRVSKTAKLMRKDIAKMYAEWSMEIGVTTGL